MTRSWIARTASTACCGVPVGAERGDREEAAGARQPAPHVAAVAGVLGDGGHRRRVHGLQQHGPDPADEHRGVAVDAGDRAVGGEPARSRGAVDPLAVARAVGAGDAAEQLGAEAFAHPATASWSSASRWESGRTPGGTDRRGFETGRSRLALALLRALRLRTSTSATKGGPRAALRVCSFSRGSRTLQECLERLRHPVGAVGHRDLDDAQRLLLEQLLARLISVAAFFSSFLALAISPWARSFLAFLSSFLAVASQLRGLLDRGLDRR